MTFSIVPWLLNNPIYILLFQIWFVDLVHKVENINILNNLIYLQNLVFTPIYFLQVTQCNIPRRLRFVINRIGKLPAKDYIFCCSILLKILSEYIIFIENTKLFSNFETVV